MNSFEQTSNSEPKESNEGNERQPELSVRTQSNQNYDRNETTWHHQFTDPFQFVKSNEKNQNLQTTSTFNHSATFKSHQLPDKQLKKSKAPIAQESNINCPSQNTCDDSDSDSDEGANQRNALHAKISSKNHASELQFLGKHNSPANNTTGNCLKDSRSLALFKQKQTRDKNNFSTENRNQPRYNESTTSDNPQFTSNINYLQSTQPIQPTNLYFTPNQRNHHININLSKT